MMLYGTSFFDIICPRVLEMGLNAFRNSKFSVVQWYLPTQALQRLFKGQCTVKAQPRSMKKIRDSKESLGLSTEIKGVETLFTVKLQALLASFLPIYYKVHILLGL